MHECEQLKAVEMAKKNFLWAVMPQRKEEDSKSCGFHDIDYFNVKRLKKKTM